MTTISEIKQQIKDSSAKAVVEAAINKAKENSNYHALLSLTDRARLKTRRGRR
jgi:hypothetical protein